jgi:amino acid adenylation domain-containing protein
MNTSSTIKQPQSMTSSVSVIIPAYNSARFLTDAIESVLRQTYPVFEIVVVDDGSTDETKEICDRYPSIKYIYQVNQGVAEARNTGTRMSRGEYLIYLDSDDCLLPRAVEIGVNCIKDRPEVGFVFGGYIFQTMNSDGSYTNEEVYENQPKEANYTTLLAAKYKIQIASAIFRRFAVESVGGFDSSVAFVDCLRLYIQIARELPIYFHGQIVSLYRYTGSNNSSQAAKMLLIASRSHSLQWNYVQQSGNKEYAAAYECGKQYWIKLFVERLPYEIMKYIQTGQWLEALGYLRLVLNYDPKLSIIDREIYVVADRALHSELRKLPIESSLAYWQQQLAGAPPLLPLPTDRSRGTEQTFRGSTRSFVLSGDLTSDLSRLSKEKGVTLFMTLLAALDTLLYRYTGTEDIIVGSPMVDRDDDGEILVNAVALRTDLAGNPSFQQLLNRVRKIVLAGEVHQDVPFEILVEELQLPQDSSYAPLFQVMLAFEEDVSFQKIQLSSLTASPWVLENNEGKFDLTLFLEQNSNELLGKWVYNTDLFDASTIDRMNEHFQILLEGIVTNPEQPIGEIPLLTAPERHQLLVEWNQTQTDYPVDKCIHQLFEQQVERTPDAVAVVFENHQLTYQQLNQRANQLAHHLIAQGVKPETLVGICVERSVDMVVGLLGIFKAGGAYLPLDPSYPQERLGYLLSDSQVSVLLTQQRLVEKLPAHQAQLFCLDTDWHSIGDSSLENPHSGVQAANLAYVIYTSGSTGQPKGVLIPHQGLLNLVFWHQRTFEITAADRATQLAGMAFDASVWELWPYLSAGASIYLAPPNLLGSLHGLRDWLIAQQITICFVPTPLVEGLLTLEWNEHCAVRMLLTGGDTLHHYPSTVIPFGLVNNYGPTENTVVTTSCLITPNRQQDVLPIIGRPISNTQVYILDRHLQLVPIGCPGELHIGGDSLATGYLNLPELTQAKFIPNIFGDDPSTRLYKTGDLARYLPDGNIEYIGRIDRQVKIRGFRIELGEIEALLAQHPAIDRTIVVVNEDIPGDKRLVAYLVANQDRKLTINALRDFLSQKLPSYMIPAAFVVLDILPLTSNGKVDRKALPAPDRTSVVSERKPLATTDRTSLTITGTNTLAMEGSFVAPRTATEEILVSIWSQVLSVDMLGISDNFFVLGGHSLLATQIISRCRTAFSIELPLRQLFESPTVADLAIFIDKSQNNESEYQTIPQRANRANAPLSFAQQRLWFLNQLEPNSPFYNFSWPVRLQGNLNVDILKTSLGAIVDYQEILRTKYINQNGNPIQVIDVPQSVELQIIDLQQYDRTEQEIQLQKFLHQESQRPINLESAMMFRGCLLKLAPSEHVLLLVMHHIASDGWSMGVFWAQLTELYTAFLNGQSNPLATLPIQYADYAVWQREWLTGEVLDHQLNYWKGQLAGANPLLELPTDRPRPPVQTYRGASQSLALSETLTTSLKQLCVKEDVTLYMTLLAAFQTLLYRYSGQEDIIVGSPIAGRNRAEIESLIGFFVNTLVLRTDLSSNPSFQELLARVRANTLDAYAYQDLPFEKLVEELNPERSLSYSPLFQVMFVFQNTPGQTAQLLGLTQTPVELVTETAQFDLTLSVEEQNGLLIGSWNYNTDLFDADTITRMSGHFQTLLEGIVEHPEQPIAQLPLLTAPERHQLLVEWNNTATEYPQDKCIHQLFEEQVERTPDAIAVVFEDKELTYRELNNKANQLAHYLQKLGINPDVLVGICVDRSLEMVVGLLGVLKAGGAYVPIDPAYPQERINYMLEDAQLGVLLTQNDLVKTLPDDPGRVICLDTDWQIIDRSSQENPVSQVLPSHLAYVIYTSGSTGKPKGVLVTHQGLPNLALAQAKSFGVKPDSCVLQFASFSFDASISEIAMTFVSGARLCLAKKESLLPGSALIELFQQQGVTHVTLSPSALAVLPDEPLSALESIIVAGEACPAELVAQWSQGRRFFNAYGPTETTVCATIAEYKDSTHKPSIGQPIANTQIYILDAHRQPVPVGVPGEIYIGSIGLARGYLNRPELTQELFIPNPFSQKLETKIYKTGDLARYLPDGNIEYLGRLDNQVKIRGFRIELGEIEAGLSQHPIVCQAVVIAREDVPRDKRLVAYIVIDPGTVLTSSELRRCVQAKLPEYMVPNFFMFLDILPLTPNGKVDLRALPAPDLLDRESGKIFVAAQDDLERELTKIWEQVLAVKKIGIRDNFFGLGGHSLLAVQLFSQIEQIFGKNLPLATLFKAPTIEELASFLRQENSSAELWGSLVPLQIEGSRPPLFCIHGGGFNVFVYRQLAQHLGTERAVYALQARGLDGGSILDRIEDMATDYIQQIKTIQPQGPYLLSGLSNGGHIALEMAQQLQSSGEIVALVAMFDSYGPDGVKLLPPFRRFLSSLLYVLQFSLPRSIAQSRQSGKNAIAIKLKNAIDRLLLARDTSIATEQDSVDIFDDRHTSKSREFSLERSMNRVSSYVLEHSPWGFFSPSAQLRDSNDRVASTLKKLEESYRKVYKTYDPQPYQGKITVFQAMESPPGYKLAPKLGWGKIANDGVELHKIPGDHTSIMESPILAEKMKDCLKKAIANNCLL